MAHPFGSNYLITGLNCQNLVNRLRYSSDHQQFRESKQPVKWFHCWWQKPG